MRALLAAVAAAAVLLGVPAAANALPPGRSCPSATSARLVASTNLSCASARKVQKLVNARGVPDKVTITLNGHSRTFTKIGTSKGGYTYQSGQLWMRAR